MPEDEIRKDLKQFSKLSIPVRRAAYSDRTAWLMAIFSELAYTSFAENNKSTLLGLATEFANLTDRNAIVEKLKSFKTRCLQAPTSNKEVLRSILGLGGFHLRGVLFDPGTDTEGFVASREAGDGTSMAVICFRGTEPASIRDWITNLRAYKVPVKGNSSGSAEILGHVHKGFNEAYKSVSIQIEKYLKGCESLPLYITGHSLGGALATLATWYLERDKLAACYTFGAPQVGDDGLLNYFRTPIYRIVNGADPVPLVPPSGLLIGLLIYLFKFCTRLVGWVPLLPFLLNFVTKFLIRFQGYKHYGYQRYLSICKEGLDGTFPKLKNEFGVGSLERLRRFCSRLLRCEFSKLKRIDKYHDIAEYRAKLHAYARRRQR